jgi:glycerol-3-phosphate dehydrogenase (NAD(P)+)
MKTHITFIGAGEIGTAVYGLVKKSGAVIDRWDANPAKVPHQKPLATIVPEADFLFLCVPSWHMRSAVASVAPLLKKKTIVVSLAKGIELKSKKTMDRLLAETLPRGQRFCLFSGPMLAEELDLGLMGAAVVASSSKNVYPAVRKLFTKTKLHLEDSSDVHGVALCGVMKNVYAMALGIVSALKMGDNAKGWFMEHIITEMVGIESVLNGKKRTDCTHLTVLGPAGLGDLICTGFSEYSSNNRVGRELVAAKKITAMSEGFSSLPALLGLLGTKAKRFPLLMTIKHVVVGKKDAKKEFIRFKSAAKMK